MRQIQDVLPTWSGDGLSKIHAIAGDKGVEASQNACPGSALMVQRGPQRARQGYNSKHYFPL